MPILAVAPHWGAWIEIDITRLLVDKRKVAPHWGAWIEIVPCAPCSCCRWSHPTGVRGLKFHARQPGQEFSGRTPLGCVD